MSIVTLTTDFGASDSFVGAMKGVMLSIAPDARIVDICHEIPPQDVVAAALVLEESCPYFPPQTIHVAVVDPGVGSGRCAVAARTTHHTYIGPDNGIFSLVLKKHPLVKAVKLNNPLYHAHPVSSTFHGRDIFGPAAAHLAAGVPFESLGDPLHALTPLDFPHPVREAGTLRIHVVSLDRFGNLMTDLTAEEFENWRARPQSVCFRVGSQNIEGPLRTYSDVARGTPVAYFGSNGRLQIAVNCGSAARELNVGRGTEILVMPECP